MSNKIIEIERNGINYEIARRIKKFGPYDIKTKKYTVPMPLIGQLGKNYLHSYNQLITGDELLKMACTDVRRTQLAVGGRYVYVECEDLPCLKNFYHNNGFLEFGERELERDEINLKGAYLIQMLRDLNDFIVE